MKIGNLVHVVQELGCHEPPMLNDLGLGVILEVGEDRRIRDFLGRGEYSLGKSVTVKLATGEVKVVHEKDFEVLS